MYCSLQTHIRQLNLPLDTLSPNVDYISAAVSVSDENVKTAKERECAELKQQED